MKKKSGGYVVRNYATSMQESTDDRYRKVAEIFGKNKFDRILDVGCGDGSFSVRLKEVSNAREVYGIEISPAAADLASKAGIKTFCLDIDDGDFPFEDNFFDAVFCGEIIEHLYDPDHLLEEVNRILKPTGLLVLSTPNLAWWPSRIALLFGFYPFGLNPSLRYPLGHWRELEPTTGGTPVFADHLRLFTISSLLKLLKTHGFAIRQVAPIAGQIPKGVPLARTLNLVDRALSIMPSLSFRFIICAIKG